MIIKIQYSLYVEQDYIDQIMKKEGRFGISPRDLIKRVARRKGTDFLGTIPGHIELLKKEEDA